LATDKQTESDGQTAPMH